jgi:hypothetical protein
MRVHPPCQPQAVGIIRLNQERDGIFCAKSHFRAGIAAYVIVHADAFWLDGGANVSPTVRDDAKANRASRHAFV